MENFRKLRVWQSAKDIAVKIYQLTNESTGNGQPATGDRLLSSKLSRDFGLKDQIQRAAISIASNIAEGDEMGTDKQSIRYFYIAKGSAAELMTQIIIANEIGYISAKISDEMIDELDKISAMLAKLIRARE